MALSYLAFSALTLTTSVTEMLSKLNSCCKKFCSLRKAVDRGFSVLTLCKFLRFFEFFVLRSDVKVWEEGK